MNAQTNRLLIEQLSNRMKGLDRAELREPPAKGWIRSMRVSLSMTTSQLAKRVGVSQPTITEWEQREKDGTITMQTMKRVADAMQCDLVYALVPRKAIHTILEERAKQIVSGACSSFARRTPKASLADMTYLSCYEV
jgi:predicted DNA-binding mobile mystery protein A